MNFDKALELIEMSKYCNNAKDSESTVIATEANITVRELIRLRLLLERCEQNIPLAKLLWEMETEGVSYPCDR